MTIMSYSRVGMKQMNRIISILLFAFALTSCDVVERFVEKYPAPVIIASMETDDEGAETKTVLREDGTTGQEHVNWCPGDELNIFFGKNSVRYYSTNTDFVSTTEFQSDETVPASDLASTNIWGLYPYNDQATCSGTFVTTSLPSLQNGVPGSFDDDLAIMVANSSDTRLFFRNVCSGLRFTLTRDDIKSITLRGNQGEVLAGSFRIRMIDGEPETSSTEAQTSVTLVPKDRETFEPDEDYIIMLLPTEMEKGFTMEFELDNARGELCYDAKAVSFPRNDFGVKRDIDSYATFHYDVTGITLNRTKASIGIRTTLTLEATVYPENATDKTVTWSSSDNSVATVEDGVVSAIKEGSVTITAMAGEKSATCEITVISVPVESLTLDKESATLKIGETLKINATVMPAESTDKSVYWISQNESVATVDEDGVVTALKAGSATILAFAGQCGASCEITVVGTPVTGVTLNKTDISLHVGETEVLNAIITPEDASDKTVSWSSSDKKVAHVDNNGRVLATSIGTSIITVETADGGYTAQCRVTVEPVHVESVALDYTRLTLRVEESKTLTAIVYPTNATDKSCTWKSSDESIATVNDGVVTGVRLGSAVITVITNDGAHKAECQVTVDKTHVESIYLNYSEATIGPGESLYIDAFIEPYNATDKSVTWTSSNPSVAKVKDGIVTGVDPGTVTITATTNDGGLTAECIVRVHNFVLFSDWRLRDYCVANFDTDNDGQISRQEAEAVKEINFTIEGGVDLNGLQYFKNLESLVITNTRPEEEWHYLGYNQALLSLTKLKHLELYSLCLNTFPRFDISTLTELEYLDLRQCYLEHLDVSKNLKLTYLDCVPMKNDIETLTVSKGQVIPNVTVNRNPEYIPDRTRIYVVDTSTGSGNEDVIEGDEI